MIMKKRIIDFTIMQAVYLLQKNNGRMEFCCDITTDHQQIPALLTCQRSVQAQNLLSP